MPSGAGVHNRDAPRSPFLRTLPRHTIVLYASLQRVRKALAIALHRWEPLAHSQAVREQIALPSAMERARATPWLEALTAEFNSNTWMVLAGDVRPAVTRKGSRPGSSWADLFYSVTVPRIIECRDEARVQNPNAARSWAIWWDGHIDLTDPSRDPDDWVCMTELSDVIWADDLAKCIPVEDPAQVASTLSFECAILTDAFGVHGYRFSFGPTKTAAIVAVRGPGSRKVRRHLFQGKAAVPVWREEGGVESLPLVTTYRHLGVQTSADAGISAEVKHRIGQAWAAFRQGRSKVYRSKRISVARRGALLATHVMTKLLFAAGAWPQLSKGENAMFSHAVLSLYRQTLAIGPDGDQHLTHATVCSLLQQPPPDVLLSVERARYLLQLFHSAPPQLWALLRRDPAYIALLRSVVQWMYTWLWRTTSLTNPELDWAPWDAMIQHRPGIFKALIKRVRGLEVARTSGLAALQALRRALIAVAGSLAEEVQPDACQYVEGCLLCRIAFPSRTAWACHASRLHGYRTAATLMAADVERPMCSACGKVFATRGRLQRHLQASARCRVAWGSFEPDLTQAGAAEVHSQAPPLSQAGRSSGRTFDFDPAELHLGLLAELQGTDLAPSEGLWETVRGYVAPLSVLRRTVDVWGAHPGPGQDPEEVARSSEDLQLLLDVDLWCEDFRAPRKPRQPVDCCPPLAEPRLARFCFVLTGVPQIFALEAPPSTDFCYPFRNSVPLAAARRAVMWLEVACDTVGLAVQASMSNPVLIQAPTSALSMLEPISSWLRQSGFIPVEGGLRTPYS